MTGTKLVAATSLGSFAGAAAALEIYGTTPLAVALAISGALLAMAETEGRRWPRKMAVLVFNTFVGALGAPVIVLALHVKMGIEHPSILVITSLFIGYLAHDVLDGFKSAFADRVSRLVRGRK